MVLRFIEGFDLASTASNLAQRGWIGTTTLGTTGARFTTSGQYLNLSSSVEVYKAFDLQDTWIVGFAFYPTTLAGSANICSVMKDATVQFNIILTSSGQLMVRRNTTQIGSASATGVLIAAQWHYIEYKATISTSAGRVQVRVNGVEVIDTGTGQNTAFAGSNQGNRIQFRADSGFVQRYDDIYILDGQPGEANDFLGNVRVRTLLPDGVGNYSEWTNSAGNSTNNYTYVDDPISGTAHDSDTTYIRAEAATTGLRDTYTHANLPATLTNANTTIKGVQFSAALRKDDTGAASVAPLIRKDGTDYQGTFVGTLGTAYSYLTATHETDPADVAAWTVDDVNNAEYGLKTI